MLSAVLVSTQSAMLSAVLIPFSGGVLSDVTVTVQIKSEIQVATVTIYAEMVLGTLSKTGLDLNTAGTSYQEA